MRQLRTLIWDPLSAEFERIHVCMYVKREREEGFHLPTTWVDLWPHRLVPSFVWRVDSVGYDGSRWALAAVSADL